MKSILLIIALSLTASLKAANCPSSVNYSSNQFTLHYSSMPSGYATFTSLKLKIVSGKGAGNTYNISIISTTSNTIVIGDASGSIDGSSVSTKITYYKGSQDMGECDNNIALPVKFTFFKCVGNSFIWQTATEVNNRIFILQSSADTKTWYNEDSLLSQNSNSSTLLDYSLKVSVNRNYWRIKQVDYDGNFEYSSVIHVNLDEKPIIINSMGIVVDAPESGIYFIYSNNTWSKIYVQK